ncbi:hypothetical protein M3G91_24455 [Micromonospora chalcea]|uniref:hypothetical protein n=1 Tax=Micromonospora chalcea TaxID=1874 RepID=UPI0021A386E6|nr:hypothetical protein [Micromonospora chalcea]MCT2280774.1 hypothetical protein [Micromonospora chalcea]
MTIRTCVVVSIEGTHAAGKTTLVHALTAHYRARGVLVACTPEPARTSPFIEETVIHGKARSTSPPKWTCSAHNCRPPCAPPATTTC